MPFRPIDQTRDTVNIDYVSSVLQYHGFAKPGTATSSANWKVAKVTLNASGDITQMIWAGSSATGLYGHYNQIWDNRASLTYA